jgi:hypothetical protein
LEPARKVSFSVETARSPQTTSVKEKIMEKSPLIMVRNTTGILDTADNWPTAIALLVRYRQWRTGQQVWLSV